MPVELGLGAALYEDYRERGREGVLPVMGETEGRGVDPGSEDCRSGEQHGFQAICGAEQQGAGPSFHTPTH